jgi:hypothetical protein
MLSASVVMMMFIVMEENKNYVHGYGVFVLIKR